MGPTENPLEDLPLSEPNAERVDRDLVAPFRRRLLAWFRRHHRDLPWRRTRDPYAIWISEIMLQQTQVATVIPYFERFLERFPNAEALAAADLDSVLELWSGLGYYSRARSLHQAAQRLVLEHRGRFPVDEEALLALPGIGRYTAGAIRSIAFDIPAPLLDGNVARVLTRVFALRGDPKSGPLQKRLWRLAAQLVAPRAASEFNQGLMELGALVCTPRQPSCGRCPLLRFCEARQLGIVEELPESTKRRPTESLVLAAAAITDTHDRLLIVRRRGERVLDGLWELPTVEHRDPLEPALRREIDRRTGLTIDLGRRLGSVRHAITYRRIQAIVLEGRCSRPGQPSPGSDWGWHSPGEEEHAFSGLARKTIGLWEREQKLELD